MTDGSSVSAAVGGGSLDVEKNVCIAVWYWGCGKSSLCEWTVSSSDFGSFPSESSFSVGRGMDDLSGGGAAIGTGWASGAEATAAVNDLIAKGGL